jgi:hypothetical protein
VQAAALPLGNQRGLANASQPAIAVSLVLGQPITTLMPIIATVIGCLVFTLIAIWRFQKEEF